MGCRTRKLYVDVFVLCCVWSHTSMSLAFRRTETCEAIQIPMCQSMPYNMTRMPNLLHHSSQENAKLSIEQFEDLLEKNCSDVLLFFLCAMYAPICTPNFQPEPIPPCRSVCEKAREGCEHIVKKHNMSWPEVLDCSNLPRYDRGVCVSPEAIVSSIPERRTTTQRPKGGRNQGKSNKPRPGGSSEGKCKCSKRQRLKRKQYKKGKYNFAIRARILGHDTANTINTVTRVSVIKVLKSTRVPITENNGIELWTNSTCVCPKLVKRREYLIIGYDDPATQRLLFFDNCIASKWHKRWEKRLKRWNKKKKTCRKRNRKNCKKNKNSNSTGLGNRNKTRNRNRENRRSRKKNRINSTSTSFPREKRQLKTV